MTEEDQMSEEEKTEKRQRAKDPQYYWALDIQNEEISSDRAKDAYMGIIKGVRNSKRVVKLIDDKTSSIHELKDTAIYHVHKQEIESHSILLRNYIKRRLTCQAT